MHSSRDRDPALYDDPCDPSASDGLSKKYDERNRSSKERTKKIAKYLSFCSDGRNPWKEEQYR